MALTQYMDIKKHTLARTQPFTSTQSSVCSATCDKDTVPDFVCRAASIRCLALPAVAAADWTRTGSSAAGHRFTPRRLIKLEYSMSTIRKQKPLSTTTKNYRV
jgi:hypothetical protein